MGVVSSISKGAKEINTASKNTNFLKTMFLLLHFRRFRHRRFVFCTHKKTCCISYSEVYEKKNKQLLKDFFINISKVSKTSVTFSIL